MTNPLEKPTGKSAIIIICLGFILFISGISIVSAQEIPYIDVSIAANEAEGNDITLKTYFKLVPAINYENHFWVVRNKDLKQIGYATWDSVSRRYTMFNFRNEYRGFLQATIGKHNVKDEFGNILPFRFNQYLWYWSDNLYRMLAVPTLGGRPPRTYKLPYGELGGDLQNYAQGNIPGNIPLRPGTPFPAIEPLKGPMGIDISVIYRLPTVLSK